MIYYAKKYGAAANGETNDAPFIQKAIDDCTQNGGGTVVCEAGTYLCSSLIMKSNVNLYLEAGCTIIQSLDSAMYKDGQEALIEAKNAENITISGFGTIDGRSYLVYYDDNQDPLHEAPLDYAVGAYRPKTTKFENITNIAVRDITIKNSVFWTLHFGGCKYVTVSGVKILNSTRSNENDGIDPDCCKNVVISDCIITAGDDPVVVKTTKAMSQKYGGCENVVVNNCIFKTKSAGLKIGTETWADIRNITMSNCVIEECGRAAAIWARDGAVIENVFISGVRAVCRAYNACNDNKHIGAGYPYWWGKGEGIYISNMPRKGEGTYSGKIKNITISDMNIDCESSVFVCADGINEISGITIKDSSFRLKKIGSQTPGRFDFRPSDREVIEHKIPAIYMDGVKNTCIKDVNVSFGDKSEAYSNAVQICNCNGISIRNLTGSAAFDKYEKIQIENSKDIEIKEA